MHCLFGSRRIAATTSTTVNGRKLHNAQPSGTVENVGDGALAVERANGSHLVVEELVDHVGVDGRRQWRVPSTHYYYYYAVCNAR